LSLSKGHKNTKVSKALCLGVFVVRKILAINANVAG